MILTVVIGRLTPSDIGPKIINEAVKCGEAKGRFPGAQVLVVAFACLVIVTQNLGFVHSHGRVGIGFPRFVGVPVEAIFVLRPVSVWL